MKGWRGEGGVHADLTIRSFFQQTLAFDHTEPLKHTNLFLRLFNENVLKDNFVRLEIRD